MKRVACIIQARTGSSRLPGKVLKLLENKPMLWHVIERVKQAETIDKIIIATTDSTTDDAIAKLAQEQGIICFRGSEMDVLSRYIGAAHLVDAEIIIRITSDCPLIDPGLIDRVVKFFSQHDYDYVSPKSSIGLMRGLDTEVFSLQSLIKAGQLAQEVCYREHVTLYIYRHPETFKIGHFTDVENISFPQWRLCVDEEADFRLIQTIYQRLYTPGKIIHIDDVIELFKQEPEIPELNKHVLQKKV